MEKDYVNPHKDVESNADITAYQTKSHSNESSDAEKVQNTNDNDGIVDVNVMYNDDEKNDQGNEFGNKIDRSKRKLSSYMTWKYWRTPILIFTACLAFGWWLAGLFTMRHRWVIQTVLAWFVIGAIFFRFVPSSLFGRPIGRFWTTYVSRHFFRIDSRIRLFVGWLLVLGIIFGSAFGFPLEDGVKYGDRVISILGIFIFQLCLYICSAHHSRIQWHIIIIGLFIQQFIGVFVLKTRAGYDIFNWIITLASDFLSQSQKAAAFFLSEDIVNMNMFLLTTLPAIMFFIAFVQLCYFIGVIQWFLKKFAWFFQKVFTISGIEAISISATPFVGQAESACLIKPFVQYMTRAEIHALLTAGFATISGSTLLAYIALGVDKVHLVTSAIMSIPASISISNMRMPEVEQPLFTDKIVIDRGDAEYKERGNWLLAFSNGAKLGIYIAGLVLTNVLTVLSLLYAFDGFLSWFGRSFAIKEPNELTLELILKYVFYPVAWLMGTPKEDVLKVSYLIGQKVIANELVAYQQLIGMRDSFTSRGYTIAEFSLCSFGNIASIGIQIGVLSSLAPTQKKVVSETVISALICGIISTCQTAAIAGMLS